MPKIVQVSDLEGWLDISLPDGGAEESAAERLLEGVEEALEHETNTTFRASAATVTDETHDGHGRPSVKVEFPIADLRATGSELKIGRDPASPVQTVDLTDPQKAAVDSDIERRIRLHQVRLPVGHANVHVTYEAAAFAPKVAQQAIVEVAGAAWQKKGAEGIASASIGRMLQFELADAREQSESWQRAVAALLNPAIG